MTRGARNASLLRSSGADGEERSAAERFRRGYGRALGVGMVVSLALHAGLVVIAETVRAPAVAAPAGPPEMVVLPPLERAEDLPTAPAVELPPAPPPVERPGQPVAMEVEPAPEAAPRFIPHDTPPLLVNAPEIQAILHDAYPPELREAGVQGVVLLWLYVDERGHVERLQLRRSSGHAAFDSLAQEVGARMKYRPALNRTEPVAVWVAQPIRFHIQVEEVARRGEADG